MTPQSSPRVVAVGYDQADALNYDCDVLALKYAQGFHGVDYAAAKALESAGVDLAQLQPEQGRHVLVPSRGAVKARAVLLLGTPPLRTFGYANIEEFARHALEVLAMEAPQTVHLAMTLHGPNFGLDPQECVLRQVAGIQSALSASLFPPALRAVTIVEKDADRIETLAKSLRGPTAHAFLEVGAPLLPPQSGGILLNAPLRDTVKVRTTAVYTADPDAGQPPSIFVAMPFDKKNRTLWKYGIEKPVHEAGLNCERMDQMYFAGDILDRMKALILRAALVVADISDENPNVFLELGYAWGVGRPTLILAQRDDSAPEKQLPFDVRTQACVFYLDPVELEERLKAALVELKLARR